VLGCVVVRGAGPCASSSASPSVSGIPRRFRARAWPSQRSLQHSATVGAQIQRERELRSCVCVRTAEAKALAEFEADEDDGVCHGLVAAGQEITRSWSSGKDHVPLYPESMRCCQVRVRTLATT
jgi:hypothetical protein